MKIAFLLTQSIECPSGLGRYYPLSRELVRLGHKVTILALHPDFGRLSVRAFVKDGVYVRYVGQMHVRKSGSLKSYFGPVTLMLVVIVSTWRLLRAALKIDVDVFHLGKPHPINSLAGVVAARLRAKPLYLDSDDYEAASNLFRSRWQHSIVRWFEDHIPGFCAGITTNTRFTQGRYEALGYAPERIFYVPNGVDRERFSGVDEDRISELKKAWDLEEKKVILYVGSLSLTNHAVDLLIDAFASVSCQDPDAVLMLVGGGEDFETIARQVSSLGLGDRVRIVGRVPPQDVKHYVKLGVLTVDPVRADGAALGRSPLKIVESMALGVPVVTGDVGDRAYLLGHGEAGSLVTPGSVDALTQGILDLLHSSALLEQKRRGCARIVRGYYWESLGRRFVRVYGL